MEASFFMPASLEEMMPPKNLALIQVSLIWMSRLKVCNVKKLPFWGFAPFVIMRVRKDSESE